jgi:hypothetical protein
MHPNQWIELSRRGVGAANARRDKRTNYKRASECADKEPKGHTEKSIATIIATARNARREISMPSVQV